MFNGQRYVFKAHLMKQIPILALRMDGPFVGDLLLRKILKLGCRGRRFTRVQETKEPSCRWRHRLVLKTCHSVDWFRGLVAFDAIMVSHHSSKRQWNISVPKNHLQMDFVYYVGCPWFENSGKPWMSISWVFEAWEENHQGLKLRFVYKFLRICLSAWLHIPKHVFNFCVIGHGPLDIWWLQWRA